MDFIGLFLEVVIISSSGVFSPGPLTVATIIAGSKKGEKSGLLIATGHMVVELPLIFAIAYGLAQFLYNRTFFVGLGVVGSAILVFYGYLMVRDGLKGTNSLANSDNYDDPFLVGVVFSATNPHFIFWWLIVGSIFLLDAVEAAGLQGLVFAYVSHIWIDYVWLYALTFAAAKGRNLLSAKGYRTFLIVMGLIVIAFGILLLRNILNALS